MEKTLFIDRDGTIIKEPEDFQIDSLEKLSFIPGAITALKVLQDNGFTMLMVSNQDNLGTKKYPRAAFEKVQGKMLDILNSEGITFNEIFIDDHLPADNHPNRKPGTGMLIPWLQEHQLDKANSYVIGDRSSDAELARNLNINSLTLKHAESKDGDRQYNDQQDIPTEIFDTWPALCSRILNQKRKAALSRKTKETDIEAELNLDGSGLAKIHTGHGFFNHMLELFTKHSGFDLTLKADGDLEVDEHHTVEDCAIVLGQLLSKALGDKRGIERYSFLLPMDEALCTCALDLSGRSGFYFKGEFSRAEINGFPTEMITHFLKSFADNAGANLHVEVSGGNAHHQAEAVFKALAKCLKKAVHKETGSTAIPSSKGSL